MGGRVHLIVGHLFIFYSSAGNLYSASSHFIPPSDIQ